MKKHGIIAAIVIFALIIAGMFIFAFLKKSELRETPPPVVETPVKTPYDAITRIDATHFYIDGVHTLVGEILLPTPCDLLNWDAPVRESKPEGVTLAFTVVNSTENCVQTVTPQRFVIGDITTGSDTVFDATLNGRSVELNLIPALAGARPENYEFSPKG